jgi:hypothetical protein
MSTRYYKNKNDSFSRKKGTEGANIPEEFDIPSCTIEDVDRALFDLFDKQIPFTYKHKKGTKRAPVIFASGERFAVLRRQEPLRDKAGALILPLVSIMRTGITQSPTMGAGTAQNVPMVIKTRLAKEDQQYQRLLNKKRLKNSDELASKSALEDVDSNPLPGKTGTRRDLQSVDTNQDGMDISLGKNIYEIIEMPPPKYYTATYEITFWAQYTLQMNDMLTAMMSVYQSFSQRTFQLETPKGYWFVGYVSDDLNPGNNFDEFTDSERLVRYSFNVTVPGYIVNPEFPGSQKTLRRYLSAPEISFDANIVNGESQTDIPAGIPSGNPADFVLDDLRTVDEPLPGQKIGHTKSAASDSRGIFKKRQGAQTVRKSSGATNIGGSVSDDESTTLVEYFTDPITGKEEIKRFHLKTRINRKGEQVLREALD